MVPGLGKVCLFGGKSWEEVQEPGVDDARVHSEDEMSNPRSAAWGRRRGGEQRGKLGRKQPNKNKNKNNKIIIICTMRRHFEQKRIRIGRVRRKQL